MPANNTTNYIRLRILLTVMLTLAVVIPGAAQVRHSVVQPSRLGLATELGIQNLRVDSAGRVSSEVPDTLAKTGHQRSALAAVLFSIVPGGGQIYNGSYWKVPIIWGVQGYFVYEWIQNNKIYSGYQRQLNDSIAAGTPFSKPGATLGNPDLETLIQLRDGALNQRDAYAWYIAGAYLLSMLDAYVDAELSGFDVSPNLGMTSGGRTLAINFEMKF